MVKAVRQANAYAARHPEAARKALLGYTKIPPAVTKRIRLPLWTQRLDMPSIRLQADLLSRYGQVKKEPDVEELYSGMGGG